MVNTDAHATCAGGLNTARTDRPDQVRKTTKPVTTSLPTSRTHLPSYYTAYSPDQEHDQELIDAASTLARVATASGAPCVKEAAQYKHPSGRELRLSNSSALGRERDARKSTDSIGKKRAESMDGFMRDRISKSLRTDGGGESGEDVDMDNDQVMDDLTASRKLFETHETPSSPLAGYRSGRISNVDDDGASSIIDMDDDLAYADPDSVPAFVAEIRRMLDYVASKPSLHAGSASFMRDYLRTLLVQASINQTETLQANKKASKMLNEVGLDGVVECSKPAESFPSLPDELAKHIFTFLDGKNLATARMVCKKWNNIACEDSLWRTLALRKWRSLETDKHLWQMIFNNVAENSPSRWREVYPKVAGKYRWKCRLMKTGRFICNLNAHQLAGSPLREEGLPSVLIVERRFNILHLRTFVLPEASILYFEPFDESDRSGYNDFIDYLIKRTRAGLALEEQRRFIFIPPCDYTSQYVGYKGGSLIGVVQNAYPPLAPA